MVEIDLEGNTNSDKKEYPKVLLERTLTTGEVTDVSNWSSEDGKEKIILAITVGTDVVNCWMNASIKKGSDPQYNTLSYDNIVALGLLDDFKEFNEKEGEMTLEKIEAFFLTKLNGKQIKFVPETITSKSGEQYSIVKKIEGFA